MKTYASDNEFYAIFKTQSAIDSVVYLIMLMILFPFLKVKLILKW